MSTQNQAKIGVATATIIGMNAMIGSGIFTAPATMATYVGPAGIVAYFLVVIAVWFMALSLARLSALFPQEGSFYTYAKQWGGHIVGLIAGFSYFIGLLIAMGLLAQIAGGYAHSLFFPHISPLLLGIGTLVIIIALNMFGVALSQLGQHILIVTTLFPLLMTTIMCLGKANLNNLIPFAPYGLFNILKATRVVIFGFFGFEAAASLFSIVHNPGRNVPRALTYSIIIVGIVYTLFVASLILAVPLHYFTNPSTPLHETLRIIFPNNNWILTLVGIAILSAIVGTIHSMVWSSSELLTALVKKIRPTNPIHISQKIAVLLIGIAIFKSFFLLTNIDLFFSFTAIFIITAFILSMITLLTMKSEWKSGQNIKSIFGIGTALIILYFALENVVHEFTKIM